MPRKVVRRKVYNGRPQGNSLKVCMDIIAGVPVKDIAEKLGVSISRIYKIRQVNKEWIDRMIVQTDAELCRIIAIQKAEEFPELGRKQKAKLVNPEDSL